MKGGMKLKLQWPGTRGWLFASISGTIVLGLPLVVSLVAPYEGQAHGFWDHIFGWWALYGAAGCAAIVVVSKWLGHHFLQKREDFYDDRT
jgi:Na+-driven multidrug efflux pump